MGADLIGWRTCELQKQLGKTGFLQKLKLKSYLAAIESQVPEGKRDGTVVTIAVNDRERDMTYREIHDQAVDFQRGIPACATCPLAGGRQLGCYHFVGYPVDEAFEETAFEFFTSQLATRDSISDQLYRDLVSKQPASGTGWHTRRGPANSLARRTTPLTYRWGGMFSKKTVDSAQLLAVLFIRLDSPALVAAYARFWRELVAFADAKIEAEMKRRGIALGKDGRITLATSNVASMPDKLAADVEALEGLLRGTLGQIRELMPMMTWLGAHCLEPGIGAIVDG